MVLLCYDWRDLLKGKSQGTKKIRETSRSKWKPSFCLIYLMLLTLFFIFIISEILCVCCCVLCLWKDGKYGCFDGFSPVEAWNKLCPWIFEVYIEHDKLPKIYMESVKNTDVCGVIIILLVVLITPILLSLLNWWQLEAELAPETNPKRAHQFMGKLLYDIENKRHYKNQWSTLKSSVLV